LKGIKKMKNGRRILWGVIYGQMIQTFLFLVMDRLAVRNMFLWAIVCGIFVTVAITAGMCVAWREVEEAAARVASQRRKAVQ
jgi:hypothetical protein